MSNFYRFRGQSNSRGAAPNADIHPSLSGTFPNIQIWNGTAYASLHVGTNQNYPIPDLFHGAAVAFLVNEQARVGGVIYACMYSIGGTPMYDDGTNLTWFPTKSGALYDISISTFNNALAYLWNVLGVRDYKFFDVWQQGEGDTTVDANANAYQSSLSVLISKSDSNTSGLSFLNCPKYWILVKISEDTSYDSTRRAIINSALDAIAATDPTRIFTYDTTGCALQLDLHHLEASGYKKEGQDVVILITTPNNL